MVTKVNILFLPCKNMDYVLIGVVIVSTALFGVFPPLIIGKLMLNKSQKMLEKAETIPGEARKAAQGSAEGLKRDLLGSLEGINRVLVGPQQGLNRVEIGLKQGLKGIESHIVEVMKEEMDRAVGQMKMQIGGTREGVKQGMVKDMEEMAESAGMAKPTPDMFSSVAGSFIEDHIPGAKKGDGVKLMTSLFGGTKTPPNQDRGVYP